MNTAIIFFSVWAFFVVFLVWYITHHNPAYSNPCREKINGRWRRKIVF